MAKGMGNFFLREGGKEMLNVEKYRDMQSLQSYKVTKLQVTKWHI